MRLRGASLARYTYKLRGSLKGVHVLLSIDSSDNRAQPLLTANPQQGGVSIMHTPPVHRLDVCGLSQRG